VASGQEDQPDRREQHEHRSSGIVVARPFGIPVYVSPYWFVIAGVFIIIYANDLSALSTSMRYVVAAAFVILLYLSVLVHELSHSVVARNFGLPVRRILLYPLGGISEIEREAPTPGREFAVAGAGPALSLVLSAIGWGLCQFARHGVPGALCRQLMVANLIVGVFNLLPGLPLDGGRMLRAVIWKLTGRPTSATIAAAWVGRVLALALLATIPFFSGGLAGGDIVSTLWVVVISAFMWTGATQSIKASRFRERLPALQARRLARKAISVPASTPLSEAIRQADEAGARAVIVVDHEGKPIAILNEAAVTATPPQRRPWVETGAMARTIDPGLILNADLQGMALLDALRRAPASEYLLTEQSGQLYGVLATRDLDQVLAGA
jgi:Zn-dependent protease/CBS domain-containing protein